MTGLPIREVDPPTSLVEGDRPALRRAAASNWPIVRAALTGGDNWLDLVAGGADDASVEILRADPAIEGRFHYAGGGSGVNFVRGRASLQTFVLALREEERIGGGHALAVQGLLADEIWPGFSESHAMSLAPEEARPRLWIGNRTIVATHRDPTHNIAVVAAGCRRFTLFPPDQADNLYLGPAAPSPAGIPVSMVHATAPDLDRYPHFAKAMERATSAELGPGDAIFIPAGWFHHVEALAPFNMLVNYWWEPDA